MSAVPTWLWIVVYASASLPVAAGVVTLARKRTFPRLGRRVRLAESQWRLSGWSQILIGVSTLLIALMPNAPLPFAPLLLAGFLACQTMVIALMYRARPAREAYPAPPRPHSFREPRWWWYDAPIGRDRLFWAMVALTIGSFIVGIVFEGQFGFSLVVVFPGCLLCALRNAYRGRLRPAAGPDGRSASS